VNLAKADLGDPVVQYACASGFKVDEDETLRYHVRPFSQEKVDGMTT